MSLFSGDPSPAKNTPRVLSPEPTTPSLDDIKLPKSVVFPVVSIVTKSIVSELL